MKFRLICASALALAAQVTLAQCEVRELAPMSPASAVRIGTRELVSLPKAVRTAVEAGDISAIEAMAGAAVRAKDMDALAAMARAIASSGNISAIRAMVKAAAGARSFQAIECIMEVVVDKWRALGGYAKGMSVISTLCRKGKYMESLGQDASALFDDISRIVEEDKNEK